MRKSIKAEHITMGVCYYPEQWDKSLWRDDLNRMKQLGIEVIRIAEFAWNRFEPQEGEFTFEFFDEFMDLAFDEGMKVIFCTPTATPPIWMSERYPEILNANIDGNKIYPGMRRHYSINSAKYRFFSARIAQKLAEHYSKYSNIVAWQLDNEINCENDNYYAESDHKAFRVFLRNRFKKLDEFNRAIGSQFWNQTYTSWEEVHLTRRTNAPGLTNPHMMLLEKRFVSDSVISYFKIQADEIRKYSNASITTNGLFMKIDYHRLVDEVLDYITYDNYPNFAYEINCNINQGNKLKDRNSSYNLMRARSISSMFGIMEQQSGPSGWTTTMIQSAPKPGQIRLWSLQAIANGADFISFFRWRTASFGTEIYWHGILNYDNRNNRRAEEVHTISEDMKKLAPVCGKPYTAEVAVLADYDNEWDGMGDSWHKNADSVSYDGLFTAFQKKHIPYNLIYINDKTEISELSQYKLIVYPHPTIFTKKRALLLEEYAKNGGTLFFGCRTGYKDINGGCPMVPMPGYAAKLCGATVEEFTFLSPYEKLQYIDINGRQTKAECFNDVLEITDGEKVGEFVNDYYKGKPGISRKKNGSGEVYYYGSTFSEDAANAVIEITGIESPMNIGEKLGIPESVELAIRGEYIFLLNYDNEIKKINCNAKFKDVLTDSIFEKEIILEQFGTVVLKEV